MATNYSYRVAWSAEDDSYVATSAEFPGLSGLADTAQHAIAELGEAIDAALAVIEAEGQPMPEPCLHSPYSGQFRLRLPKSLHAQLAAIAENEGVSLNTMVISRLSQVIGAEQAISKSSQDFAQLLEQLMAQTKRLAEFQQTMSRETVVQDPLLRTLGVEGQVFVSTAAGDQ